VAKPDKAGSGSTPQQTGNSSSGSNGPDTATVLTIATLLLGLVCAIAGATYFYGRLEQRVLQLESAKGAVEAGLNACTAEHNTLKEEARQDQARLEQLICELNKSTFDTFTLTCKEVPLLNHAAP
jgi:hypothetical protein